MPLDDLPRQEALLRGERSDDEGPLPRGCRYMRGGGAAGSSEHRQRGQVHTGSTPKPLSIPQRPLVTIYTETGLFGGHEDDETEEDLFCGQGGAVTSPFGAHSGFGVRLTPNTSPGVGPNSLASGDISPFSRAAAGGVSNPADKTSSAPHGQKESCLIRVHSFNSSIQASSSFPTQIAPIVPYGDVASRRRLAETLEKKAADSEKRSKEKSTKGAKPKEELTRVQVVKMGIRRMKERLKDLKLVIRRVKNDGNCQFRALSQQLLGTEECHDIVRYHVVSYMKRVRKEQFDCYFESSEAADRYFQRLSRLGSWGDELTLRGASDSLFVNIYVISSEEENFVIVYRPQRDAPSAPAFLVDVAKTRAAMREEQRTSTVSSSAASRSPSQLLSTTRPPLRHLGEASREPSTAQSLLSPLAASCPVFQDHMSSSGPPTTDLVAGDDELDVDVALLQNRLQSRLAKSTIHSGQPYFMRMGESVKAVEHTHATYGEGTATPPLSRSMVWTSSSWNDAAFTSPSPPPRMEKTESTKGGARSFDPALLYNRKLEAKKKGEKGGQQARFLAAGAEVEPDIGHLSIRIFRPDTTAVDVPAPPAQRLLHPVAPQTVRRAEPTTPSGKQNAKKSRWEAGSSSAPPLDDPSVHSFPVFPHVEGVTTLTLHASRTPENPSLRQSFAGGRSVSFGGAATGHAESIPDVVGSSSFGGEASTTLPQFHFEAHSTPIDVFLSYLFPVHYNALAPDDGNFPNDPSTWFRTIPDAPAEKPQPASSPTYVSVPFLRPTTASPTPVPSGIPTPVPSRRNSLLLAKAASAACKPSSAMLSASLET